MDDIPRTRYAQTRDRVHIAYQVFGVGPVDILHCGVHWWHLEYQWTERHHRAFWERLGELGRVVLFDKRGTGLSDRVAPHDLPSLEAITAEQATTTLERMQNHWDEPVNLQLVAPSHQHDPEAIEWWTTMQRLAVSPSAAVTMMEMALATDSGRCCQRSDARPSSFTAATDTSSSSATGSSWPTTFPERRSSS